MSEATDRYRLPLLQSGQAQKEVTHNEALAIADAVLQLAVESRLVATPPAAPQAGTCWIIAAAATGAWAGRAGQIAIYSSSGWAFVVPREGCLAWIASEGIFAVFTGTSWRADGWPVTAVRIGGRQLLATFPAAIANPAGGTTIDVEARTAISAILAAVRSLGLIAP